MGIEPYKAGLISKGRVLHKKKNVVCRFVATSGTILDKRGYRLIAPRTRAVLTNEIHELILTDEMEAGPEKTVDHVVVLGFVEVKTGGMIVVGDFVSVKNQTLGEIAGFDLTHMPNHMNIIMKAPEFKWPTLNLDDEVMMSSPKK